MAWEPGRVLPSVRGAAGLQGGQLPGSVSCRKARAHSGQLGFQAAWKEPLTQGGSPRPPHLPPPWFLLSGITFPVGNAFPQSVQVPADGGRSCKMQVIDIPCLAANRLQCENHQNRTVLDRGGAGGRQGEGVQDEYPYFLTLPRPPCAQCRAAQHGTAPFGPVHTQSIQVPEFSPQLCAHWPEASSLCAVPCAHP